jgi:hypothetical protein
VTLELSDHEDIEINVVVTEGGIALLGDGMYGVPLSEFVNT